MNPNRNKKKRKNNKETKSDYIVSADAVSFGIVCQRTINQRKISKTNFGYPRNVIIGFGGKSNNVLFEYVSSKENMELISGFFSQMNGGEEFKIEKPTGEWTDGVSKKRDYISGTYRHLSYKNNNIIIAEKTPKEGEPKIEGDSYHKCLSGLHFIYPPEFSKNNPLNSNMKISKITNYLNQKTFSDLNIASGDTIRLDGTQHNDETYTVLEYTIDSGREILTVTPQIKQDEDRIAMETRISKLHRSNKSVERTQVRPTSGNVVNTQQSQTSTTSTTSNQTSPTRSTTRTTTTRSSSSSSPSGGGGGMRSTSGGY
tara:strand:- start:931 stop:1872 length:942 start_codon:yes stop_codon:yes gene_type:complete